MVSRRDRQRFHPAKDSFLGLFNTLRNLIVIGFKQRGLV
jgi:hypothetical protein